MMMNMISTVLRAGKSRDSGSRVSLAPVVSGGILSPFNTNNVSMVQSNVLGGVRSFGTARSHSASKKRFKPRAKGGMVYKPAGRKHGMHRHSRNRNRTKGAGVVISRNEHGDMWKRLRNVHIDMRARGVAKPRKTIISGTETVYEFSNQIKSSNALLSIVSKEITTDMAPKPIAIEKGTTAKKVQWRVAAKQ